MTYNLYNDEFVLKDKINKFLNNDEYYFEITEGRSEPKASYYCVRGNGRKTSLLTIGRLFNLRRKSSNYIHDYLEVLYRLKIPVRVTQPYPTLLKNVVLKEAIAEGYIKFENDRLNTSRQGIGRGKRK